MSIDRTVAGPVSVAMRAYYSSYHRWAAERFARHVHDVENREGRVPRFDIEHRAYATATIFSSVAFLEAAINEILKDAADRHSSYLAPISTDVRLAWADFWEGADDRRFGMLRKYQQALVLASLDAFEEQNQPYRDAYLTIQLRNALVHYKPESLSADSPERFTELLDGKFPENRLLAGSANPFFPDKCLGAGCASWALESVVSLADAFYERIGVVPNYQRVFTESRDSSA